MDEQELARADQWFQRWGQQPCPVCHSETWRIQPKLGQIENLAFGPGLYFSAGPPGGRVPVLIVTCTTCGYFLTVNAIVAGVRQFDGTPGAGGT